MNEYPKPWRVKFNQKFPEWHKMSCPTVVDANGNEVLTLKQNVEHPGMFDQKRLEMARGIVESINRSQSVNRG